MKTPERFNRAIKALVQAFFNDTLAKYNCKACAVGNIVAFNNGLKVENIQEPGFAQYGCEISQWTLVTAFDWLTEKERSCFSDPEKAVERLRTKTPFKNKPLSELHIAVNKAFELVAKTGYSTSDLYEIEKAFELATNIKYNHYQFCTKEEIMQDQFNGLMAVVEVLCEIDNVEPTEYKKAFEYTADFKPVHELFV